jgi:hypothetical protein
VPNQAEDQAEDPSAKLPDSAFERRGVDAVSDNNNEAINQLSDSSDSSDLSELSDEEPTSPRVSARHNKGQKAKKLDPSDPTTYLTNSSFMCLPQNIQDVDAFVAKLKADPLEPRTYKTALASHDAAQWKKAMDEEVDALLKNKTWKRVKRLDPKLGIRVLRGKWVYKLKRKVDNTIARFKARWVVKGYEQLYGIDYDQTFAGVAKT